MDSNFVYLPKRKVNNKLPFETHLRTSPKDMPKILALHPSAELALIANKVNRLNGKSGPFDLVLLLGDAAPESEDTLKDVVFNVPAYFASGEQNVEYLGDDAKDLADNLSYMGHTAIFTTSENLTVAFITGHEDTIERTLPQILEKLESKVIDILVTYQWPNVLASEKELFFGNTNIDTIVQKTHPKYHFAVGSSSGKFYERAPFQWENSQIVTRFISLGKYGSSDKWIYAFNLDTESTQNVPTNLTKNPFDEVLRIQKKKEEAETIQSSKRKRDEETDSNTTVHKAVKKVVLPENCFFCLSNPKLEAHMIVSIGEQAYLTIAKGPLTRPTSSMKFSGHCIIIPIQHVPALLPTEEHPSVITLPLYNEILRYQIALVKFFASFNLSTVFFQINRAESVHFHIQAYPIAEDFLVDFEKVLNKSQEHNNSSTHTWSAKLDFKKFANTSDEKYIETLNSRKDYISFTIFHGSIDKQEVFISDVPSDKRVDLQFGRRVMAYLLQTLKRLKWDKCQQGKIVEEHEAQMFKESFKPYDFTLDL